MNLNEIRIIDTERLPGMALVEVTFTVEDEQSHTVDRITTAVFVPTKGDPTLSEMEARAVTAAVQRLSSASDALARERPERLLERRSETRDRAAAQAAALRP